MKKRAIWVGAGWLWATLNAGCQALPAEVVPDATAVLPDAAAVLPDAEAALLPDAEAVLPDAEAALPDATAVLPDAEAALPDATAVLPDAVVLPDAAAVLPDAAAVLPDAAVPEPPPPASEPEPPPPASEPEPPPPAAIPDPGLPPTPALEDNPADFICVVVDEATQPAQPTPWALDGCDDDPIMPWYYPQEWPPPLAPPGRVHRSDTIEVDRSEFGSLTTEMTEWRWDDPGALFYIGVYLDWIDLSDPRSQRTHDLSTTLCREDARGWKNLSGYGLGFAEWDSFQRRFVLLYGSQYAFARMHDDGRNVVREMDLTVIDTAGLDPRSLLPIAGDHPWPTRDYHRGMGGRIEWIVDRVCRQSFPPIGITLNCDDVSFTHFLYEPGGALVGAEFGTPSGVHRRERVGEPCP